MRQPVRVRVTLDIPDMVVNYVPIIVERGKLQLARTAVMLGDACSDGYEMLDLYQEDQTLGEKKIRHPAEEAKGCEM